MSRPAPPRRSASKEDVAPAVRKSASKEDVAQARPALRKAPSKEAVEAAPAPAPAPAAKAPKAAALPTRGAVLTKSKKVAAKALPTRGVVKTTAKAKAIAAKSFAAVAAKAKTAAGAGSAPGSGTWYFMSDLRKMKKGVDDDKAWTKFAPKPNKALEMAYKKGDSQYTMAIAGHKYIVKFKSMMQFRADDKSLQRPVKRV
mmetsp:Transcript_9461/g.17571  ORF Transcript_9461/g.17571 Transcript_9461/m.17571 type:complete len:200 (+) Transcript_9461:58-657(+)